MVDRVHVGHGPGDDVPVSVSPGIRIAPGRTQAHHRRCRRMMSGSGKWRLSGVQNGCSPKLVWFTCLCFLLAVVQAHGLSLYASPDNVVRYDADLIVVAKPAVKVDSGNRNSISWTDGLVTLRVVEISIVRVLKGDRHLVRVRCAFDSDRPRGLTDDTGPKLLFLEEFAKLRQRYVHSDLGKTPLPNFAAYYVRDVAPLPAQPVVETAIRTMEAECTSGLRLVGTPLRIGNDWVVVVMLQSTANRRTVINESCLEGIKFVADPRSTAYEVIAVENVPKTWVEIPAYGIAVIGSVRINLKEEKGRVIGRLEVIASREKDKPLQAWQGKITSEEINFKQGEWDRLERVRGWENEDYTKGDGGSSGK